MIVNTLIVGGGPAGIAPLISAGRSGSLDRILEDGVAIVDSGSAIGAGRLGRYAINSDSSAKTLLSSVVGNSHPIFAALLGHPVTEAVAAYGQGAVPLTLVARFMEVVGAAIRERMAEMGNPVLLAHEAVGATEADDGLWRTKLRRVSDGAETSIVSRYLVLATGGHQPLACLESRRVGGRTLLPAYATKLVQSDEALTPAGLAKIATRLVSGRTKHVAIIGSSSSALACANALLRTPFGREMGEGAVTVLHRRPLRVFYPSAEAALAEGYDEFGAGDICPISGFVFRLAGFRLEARELLMAVRGIGGRPPEKRLRLRQVGEEFDAGALRILDEADAVIVALGYRPRALPILRAAGQALPLLADEPGGPPMVDDLCRVLDARGAPIEGLLGIGLAAGFISRDLVGGELSFSGQSNSLWQWQNDVGGLIARQVQETAPARPAYVGAERRLVDDRAG